MKAILPLIRNVFIVLLVCSALLGVMLLFGSCNGPKRVAVAAARYPAAFAKECASRYPVKDSVVTNTVYKEGAIQYLPGDTITVDCDTVREYVKGAVTTRTVRVPCPPQQVRVDTMYQTTFRQVENTARVDALQRELQGKDETLSRITTGRNTWRWVSLISLGLILLTVVLRFIKPKLF